jgi:hypothetical protein
VLVIHLVFTTIKARSNLFEKMLAKNIIWNLRGKKPAKIGLLCCDDKNVVDYQHLYPCELKEKYYYLLAKAH